MDRFFIAMDQLLARIWFFTVIIFGIAALFLFICSIDFIQKKRYALGLAFGILELFSAAVSSSAWAWALKVSGKSDWFIFGLFGYTPIALICFSMFAVGVFCILVNIRGLTKLSGTPEN